MDKTRLCRAQETVQPSQTASQDIYNVTSGMRIMGSAVTMTITAVPFYYIQALEVLA